MLRKIVSGGQTGADRAALDFAIAHEIPHGGWCPRGRLAEDGNIGDAYCLNETPDAEYAQRTEWNVRDSDATVIFSVAPVLSGGSLLTAQLTEKLGKPHLHLSRTRDGEQVADLLRAFLQKHRVAVLNIAGPRESSEPMIGSFVQRVLEEVWQTSAGKS